MTRSSPNLILALALVTFLLVAGAAADLPNEELTTEQKLRTLRFFTEYFRGKTYKGCRPVIGFTFCSDIDIEVDSRRV